MDLEGTYHDGVIVPDDATSLSEGARVRILPAGEALREPDRKLKFGERYAAFKGCLEGLPEDFAAQHDHYRLGTPKR